MGGSENSQLNKIRLSKLMSEKGLCSRREADEYIAQGLVLVDGQVVSELGTKVSPDVSITLQTEALQKQKNLVTIILNKPVGYVSSQPEDGYEPAIVLLTLANQWQPPEKSRGAQPRRSLPQVDPERLNNLAVTGRLDIDSQGLLIFTQDGRIAKKIIGENSEIEKEYLVRVQGSLSDSQLKLLCHGLELDGKKLKQARVEWINQDQLRFVLKEGKKRQIRRMCDLVGLKVLGLK
ncbi:MAG: pseudouridine synthase, partial [Pseudobdellovibrionaceae bacterium]